MAAHAAFFTQTGSIPIYKKLMHLFRVLVPQETATFAMRWNMPPLPSGFAPGRPHALVDGLLPLFCEGLVIYNLQKTCGPPYPIVSFDSYCAPVFFGMKAVLDEVLVEHILEGTTSREDLFISTFNQWRHAHPPTWTSAVMWTAKPMGFRVSETGTWKATRAQLKWSIRRGLKENQREALYGAASIRQKIANRLAVIGEKDCDDFSLDTNIFELFETSDDLAKKYKRDVTAGRTVQCTRQLGELMAKHWRIS